MLTKKYILECLEKYCCFDILCEDNFYNQVVAPLTENNCFECEWTWDNGVTKGVLIFKELDFVIKIPFVGREHWTESHYENTDGSWIWEGDTRWNSSLRKIDAEVEFCEFDGSPAMASNWNYCAAEAELSRYAKEAGLKLCFAVTEFLGEAKDHPIYIQEKCCMFDDAFDSNYTEYEKRTSADYESLRAVRKKVRFWGTSDDWTLDFLIYWGEEMLEKLSNFIDEYNIEDLHNGNIGYRNGVPCIVDYSSYHS